MLTKGFFRLARNTASYSNCKIKVGAVIARKTPISVGFNSIKTHPRYCNPNFSLSISIHAEMNALLRAKEDNVEGCDIFVYREVGGIPALARPCDMCYNALKIAGIRRMYYTIGYPPYWKCEKL